MPVPANLVHQLTTGTGTGNLPLTAVPGKQTFGAAFPAGTANECDYFVSHRTAAEWEYGTAHVTAGALVRDTVIGSSNANVAVNFSAGDKDVTNDIPAAKQVTTDTVQTLSNKTFSNCSGYKQPTERTITVSETWNKPAGCTKIRVTLVAGGGAGCGRTASASNMALGGGGAAGGAAQKLIDVTSIASESVTIGAGGIGGTGAGAAGGSTSFGAHCSATGGSGGQADLNAGSAMGAAKSVPAAGTGTGGDRNFTGGTNSGSIRESGTRGFSGNGGDAPLGLGIGGAGVGGGMNGGNGGGYGSGGGGANSNSATARSGGNGAGGCVIVEEFY